MPHDDFIYLGDTARVPYGRKPPEMVLEFAREIAGFLCAQGVEGLVVACNTASAVALSTLEKRCPVPVWGVIDPGVSAATRTTRNGCVGVIGTKGTIGSGAYQRRLEARGMRVWAQACPMLVHAVEEGLADSAEAELLVRHYLGGRPEIDTLILGCTHYPLLRAAIQRVVGDSVMLVDSAEATADVVSGSLTQAGGVGDGHVLHFVTRRSLRVRAHRARHRRRGGRDPAASGDRPAALSIRFADGSAGEWQQRQHGHNRLTIDSSSSASRSISIEISR